MVDINARYAAYLALGFPTADFDGQPEPETLQCRNELDRTNWLGLIVSCQAAVGLGAGDLTGPSIRCTSNRMYEISYADGLGRMFALLSLVQAAQENWWRMKDLARAAVYQADLDAIDLEEGWP